MTAKPAKPTTCPSCGWERKGRTICPNCATVFYDDDGPDRPPEFASYIPAFFWGLVVVAVLLMAAPVLLFSSEPTGTRDGAHRRGGSSVAVMLGGVVAGGALLSVAFRYRRTRGGA